jgi:toxin-antitoxin system PIN domain toxin
MTEILLLDANVLIALSFTDHVHHTLATGWFGQLRPRFATCPITEGALVRFTLRNISNGAESARQLLAALESLEGHEFWPDDVPCTSLPWRQIAGYRQVTDGYLTSLARHHGGRLATLDASLAAVFPDAVLVTPG